MAEIKFADIKLFRERMTIALPEKFKDMPEYVARKKYPSKYRPPIILTSEDTLVNYLFNLVEVPLPKSELYNVAKGLYNSLKRTQAMGKFGEINIADRVKGQIAWFPYDTQTVDADLFQIVYLTDIDGKLMYGGFNCLADQKDVWFDNALYSITSIREMGGQAL